MKKNVVELYVKWYGRSKKENEWVPLKAFLIDGKLSKYITKYLYEEQISYPKKYLPY